MNSTGAMVAIIIVSVIVFFVCGSCCYYASKNIGIKSYRDNAAILAATATPQVGRRRELGGPTSSSNANEIKPASRTEEPVPALGQPTVKTVSIVKVKSCRSTPVNELSLNELYKISSSESESGGSGSSEEGSSVSGSSSDEEHS